MATMAEESLLPFSETFCADDAEITFRSIDNRLFKIHTTNLKACTEDLSPPEGSTFHEIVSLSEISATLELLFKFIYPIVQPDLALVEFDALALLAEAAEKYQVFSAMNLCHFYMLKSIPQYPASCLAYALKHNYPEIINEAAPRTLDIRVDAILELIPEHFVTWVRYHAMWQQTVSNALANPYQSSVRREVSAFTMMNTMAMVARRLYPHPYLELDVNPSQNPGIAKWLSSLKAEILKIPAFCDLMARKEPARRQDTSFLTENKSYASADESKADIYSEPNEPVITFISSDDKTFHVPQNYITSCSIAFPSQNENDSTHICLSETSNTLDLLFQFVHPIRHPDLAPVGFDVLAPLASAAEKYQVYPAMGICRLYMKGALPLHANLILAYAVKGRYYDILELAVPLCIGTPLETVAADLPIDIYVPWTKYRDRCNQAVHHACSFYKELAVTFHPKFGRRCSCGSREEVKTMEIMHKLSEGASVLQDLDGVFQSSHSCCDTRRQDLLKWQKSLERSIAALPSFSTFI